MPFDTFPPIESINFVWYQMYGSFKFNSEGLIKKGSAGYSILRRISESEIPLAKKLEAG
jgi:hypothetical protein